MKSTGERRPHWGRRALGLALIGGLVGWIVAFVGFLVMLQALDEMMAGPNHSQYAGPIGPEIEGDLMLGALAYGAPCGAVLGLVIWSVWFLVSRRARGHRSRPSDV